MFFYRQGEITDEKERENLQIQSQEVGDEYQKGLALCVLAGIFVVTGCLLLTFYAFDDGRREETANTLMIGGIFTLGIAALFGLPGVAFILLFYQDQRKMSASVMETSKLIELAHNISDLDTTRLLRSAHKLAMKLERASQDSMEAYSKSVETIPRISTGGRKMRSFSEFGRTETVSNFELYRTKLLKHYLETVLPTPAYSDNHSLPPDEGKTESDQDFIKSYSQTSLAAPDVADSIVRMRSMQFNDLIELNTSQVNEETTPNEIEKFETASEEFVDLIKLNEQQDNINEKTTPSNVEKKSLFKTAEENRVNGQETIEETITGIELVINHKNNSKESDNLIKLEENANKITNEQNSSAMQKLPDGS